LRTHGIVLQLEGISHFLSGSAQRGGVGGQGMLSAQCIHTGCQGGHAFGLLRQGFIDQIAEAAVGKEGRQGRGGGIAAVVLLSGVEEAAHGVILIGIGSQGVVIGGLRFKGLGGGAGAFALQVGNEGFDGGDETVTAVAACQALVSARGAEVEGGGFAVSEHASHKSAVVEVVG
jgi:hypothetical protein